MTVVYFFYMNVVWCDVHGGRNETNKGKPNCITLFQYLLHRIFCAMNRLSLLRKFKRPAKGARILMLGLDNVFIKATAPTATTSFGLSNTNKYNRTFLTTTTPTNFVVKKQNIILLKDVPGLGVEGQQVSVKYGYSRNYLLRQKIGVRSTEENMAKYGKDTDGTEVDLKQLALQQKKMSKLSKKIVTFQRVTKDGKNINTKVTKEEFVNTLKKQHGVITAVENVEFGDTKVDSNGEDIFKTIGEHFVTITKSSDSARMKVIIKKR
jgi:ribosomal protein L9